MPLLIWLASHMTTVSSTIIIDIRDRTGRNTGILTLCMGMTPREILGLPGRRSRTTQLHHMLISASRRCSLTSRATKWMALSQSRRKKKSETSVSRRKATIEKITSTKSTSRIGTITFRIRFRVQQRGTSPRL
jgi:hypothetical protein